MKIDLTKRSPSPGFMYDFETQEITLTRAPANKQPYFLTKSQGEIELTMDEIVDVLKNADFEGAEDLAAALEDRGIDSDGIEAAKAIAVIKEAYSDAVSEDVLADVFEVEQSTDSAESDEDDAEEETTAKADGEDDTEVSDALKNALDRVNNRLDSIEKRVEESEEESRLETWKNRVSDLEAVPGDADELAQELLDLERSVDEDTAEKHLERLRSVQKVAESGGEDVFKEHGSSASGGSGSDAYDKLKKRAQEIANENEDVGASEAMRKAREENPELAQEYRESF